MSKRCKLQKEYYKEFGNYKGVGKYSDDYVKWLEDKVLHDVVGQSEQLCDCGSKKSKDSSRCSHCLEKIFWGDV